MDQTDKRCDTHKAAHIGHEPRQGAYSLSGIIWASSQENLSSGFLTKRVSNQPAQLQKLGKKLKFLL